MKILLLGATGKTGKLIIEQAMVRGHEIVAIARNPEQLKHYDIKIISGTPYEYEIVEASMIGCNAVINLLDVSRTSNFFWSKLAAPKDLISRSASNAIRAMEKQGIKRIIAFSTFGAGRSWKTVPILLKFVVSISNLKYAFRDLGRQEELLENSTLDYTICRAPKLIDKRNDSGVLITSDEGKSTVNPLTSQLSRFSAAEYCLTLIEENNHLREVIILTNKT